METLKKKFKFLHEKPNMPRDNKIIMGWFTANNQVLLKKYLNNVCSGKSIVIEFGAWLGVSSNFIADNISSDSTLICVDWWKGDTSIGNKEVLEDELYNRYIDNVWNNRTKIVPVRMDGKKAAVYISKLGIIPDLIYLDMGHSYDEVIEDLNVITASFPNVIIVGDDYLYWPGVRKAVLETRYKLDIPYLDVDKNCYALLYKGQDKYMTYDNDSIGRKIKKFYDKRVKKYSHEEIQYSLYPTYVENTIKVFIIPVYDTQTIKTYTHLFTSTDISIVVLSTKKESIFSIYNYGYIYFNDNLKEKGKIYTYIFIDPDNVVSDKDYKCTNGLLSITKIKDINQEVYSSLGTMSIDEATMKKLKYFPHSLEDININRFFLFKKLIDNKLMIYQHFAEKEINDTEINWDKLHKSLSKKKNKYYKIYNKPTIDVKLNILHKQLLKSGAYIIMV
jgi:hypothetical protein